jgi:NTP pyrophosphatase (non-canonical NTP hydrolase)
MCRTAREGEAMTEPKIIYSTGANVPSTDLAAILASYYEFRYGGNMPSAEDALLFLVSEVGELSDAFVSQKPDWIRNNPDKVRSIRAEVGDVFQMLLVFCAQMGINPIEAMKAKWRSKGWPE